jgi:MOB kinase activator 1
MKVGYQLTLCSGVAFPRNFRDTVRTIVRRLFRVYAHIYSNHFDHICALGIEGMFTEYIQNVYLTILWRSPP